jgi:Ca2+-binding RTX toxin-like protein
MKHGILKSKFSLLTGAFLSSLAVLALALFASSTMASTAGGIVIHGSEDVGSHLKLAVSGGNLVVNGYTESGEQTGCEFTHGQNALLCPFAGVSQVEVNMGKSNDKVEVLEPLPVPLVTHLGGGSDKFIGSGEPDTCYLEGTDSSSCYGNGGNDVCISGAGGDGCYGGPGNDVCKMGAGEDKCLGEDGNDRLYGGSDSDHLAGGPGNDYVYGEADSDKLFGEAGNDYVNGGSSSDKLYGGLGNDHLSGGPSPDKLYGEAGKDYCDGGPGVGRSYACESGPGH